MKLLTVIGVIVAVALALGMKFLGEDAAAAQEIPESAITIAHRGPLAITVTETGYLKAKNSEEIKPEFNGGAKVTWLIEEGEEVVEGDVLAEFDKTELERRIDDLENQLIQYDAELEAAQSALAIQQRDGGAAVEKSELQVELKQLELKRYEEGDLPNERRKKVLASEKAASEYDRAKERFEQVPELAAEGFLTKIQVEEERIKLREAEIGKENAERELELYETYTTAMELKQKQSNLRDAERELANAKEKSIISLKEKQARVTQKERQIAQTNDQLAKEREELSHYTIASPGPGIVYIGDPDRRWMRDQIKVGNHLSSGHTMFTLPDLTEMQVLIQVHEADIDLVDVDMPVLVTVETHKGRDFEGKVTDIATVATSQSWVDESNKTFRVEITMGTTDIELRAGVTARVEIQVEELPDVLQVPIHSIVAESGERFCFVLENGQIEKRVVEVGKNNAHYVEIASGLEDGARVLLYDPRAAGEVGGGSSPSIGGSGEDEDEDLGLSSELSGMGA